MRDKDTGKYISREIRYTVNSSGCWICTSHKLSSTGYPRTTRQGKNIKVMRVLFEAKNGKIKKGLHLRHTCDNRKCINPSHLLVGTNADNVKDKVCRNRQLKGEDIPQHKLSKREVCYVRKSKLKGKDLAKKYGVSVSCISSIRQNRNWKHLEG